MTPALLLKRAGVVGSVIPILIGITTLAGYLTNNSLLKTLGLGTTEMNPVVGLLMIFSGLALLAVRFKTSSSLLRNGGQILSLSITYVGAVKLGSLLVGYTSYIDTALFPAQLETGNTLSRLPLGMAPNTALTFVFTGIALILLFRERFPKITQTLVLLAGIPPLVTAIGYLYGAESVSFFSRYIAMAGNTAVSLLAIVIALFSVLPNSASIKKLLLGSSAGSLIFRRLLPFVFLIPIAIGYLIEAIHTYDGILTTENAVSMAVVLTTFTLGLIVWHESSSIERISADNDSEVLRSLSLAFGFVADPVVVTDPAGRVVYANSAVSARTGFSLEECIGKKPGELWGGHMPKEFYQKMWHTIAVEKREFFCDVQNKTKDGVVGWQELRVYPVLNSEKNVQFIIGIQPSSEERKRLELEKLQALEGKYVKLFDQLDDVVFTLTKTGTLTSLNPAFEKITGWKPEEWVNKAFAPLLHPADIPLAMVTIGDMLANGQARTRQIRFKKQNGEFGIAEIMISPQKESGAITGIIGIARDITQRKKIEDELLALSVSVEASNDAIIGKSLDGTITSWNKGAEKLYGYSAEEAIGKSIHFFVPKEKFSEIDSALEAIRRGEAVEPYETERIAKDGRIIEISLNHFPIRNSSGELVGSAAIARDITSAKESVRRLVTLEKDLELEKAKEGFVSMAAHQLRTPLTAIQGYTEMLTLGDAGPLNDKQKEYLLEVFQANKRMIDLINALLDVSRIDFGTFSISPVPANIKTIAETQLHELEAQISAKKLTIIRHCEDAPQEMMLDPKLTGIIFQNLLSNAVKYTPEGGMIECSISQCAPNICITVSDTGIGIPESQKSKIFSKLFRADNAMITDPGGTGLGLYIVKAIVEKSGGEIKFSSQEGKGTKFELYLPITGMKAHTGTKQLSS